MKSFSINFGIAVLVLLSFSVSAQNIQWRSFINDVRYQEPGCSDCFFTNPDPVFVFRTKDNGTASWFTYTFTTTDVNCDWLSNQFSPPTFAPPYLFVPWISTGIANQIQLEFDGWEPDPWPCNPDDAACGGFGAMTFNSGAPINAAMHIGQNCEPCALSNQIEHFRQCTSDGTTGTYSVRWQYEWRYNQAPTITTQPNANSVYCVGTPASPLTVAVANDDYGRSGSNGMMRHIQWQVSNSTSCSGATNWTNIPGANGASFTPPQISGTRLYRALISANCTANFSTNTAISNCATVTYHPSIGFSNAPFGFPFGAGDSAPQLASSICGGTVLPNTVHALNALLPPAAGSANNITGYTWNLAGPGSISATTGTSIQFTAPSTPGTSTITLTYNNSCTNYQTTCVINTGSEACDYVYVAPNGVNNPECGGPDNPCLTLSGTNGALAKVSSSRNHIKMAVGIYDEQNIINLQSSLIVEGRYEVNSGIWTKTSNTDLATLLECSAEENINSSVGHRIGMKSDAKNNWKLIDLNITTSHQTTKTSNGSGKSNYALYITNNSSDYEITRCIINSGDASQGTTGSNGGNGGNGGNGEKGQNGWDGCGNDGATTGGNGGSAGSAGTGGSNNGSIGSAGGNGGNGANDSGNSGQAGTSTTCANGGAGSSSNSNFNTGAPGQSCGMPNPNPVVINNNSNQACSCTGTLYGTLDVNNWTVNQSQDIASNIYAGERSRIFNTVRGAVYRISSCSASYDSQLSIYTIDCEYVAYNDDNGPACNSNRASVDVTSPGGDLIVKLSQFNCGTNSTNTTVSVQLLSLPGRAASGSNGSTVVSSYTGGFYNPSYGTNGGGGSGGGSGAGGGGGGTNTDGCNASGNAGGGGGGGGGGAAGGAGARGGGSSYGIFLWNNNAAGNIIHSQINTGTAGSFLTGGTGGIGGNGGRGGFGNIANDNGGRVNKGGPGGHGQNGGNGGNGGSANAGVRFAIAVQGTSQAPTFTNISPSILANSSTSGGSLINSPVVSINSNNAKICQNSTLEINTSNPSWTLPSGWEFTKYNNTAQNSQWTNTSTQAEISTNNASGIYNLTANGVVFNSYLHVREGRTLPVINVPGTICEGGVLNLSATSWGNEVEFLWEIFEGNQADDKGVSSNLIFGPYTSPNVETGVFNNPGTYTIRYQVRETCCGWSRPVFATVTVEEASVAPSSIDVLGLPYCLGGELNLERVGGSLANGASWEWFEESCDTSPIGFGNSIVVSPSNSTYYLLRAGIGSACPPSECVSIEVVAPQTSTLLSVNNDEATCKVTVDDWVHFYNESGRLIASVNSHGFDLGNVTARSFLASEPHVMGSCTDSDPQWNTAAMARSFVITPSNPLTGNATATIRLYFTDGDWTTYLNSANSITPENDFDTPSSLSEMGLTKFSPSFGNPENGNPNDNCGNGSLEYLTNSASGNINSLSGFNNFNETNYLEYSITSFSEFYPMYSGNFNSALPVELTAFSAICETDRIVLRWTSASELNSSHYILQSSRDGSTWLTLNQIQAAGTTNQTSHYQYEDQVFGGLIYYRLIQVDLNGSQNSYGPISANCDVNQNDMYVFPNPVQIESSIPNFTVVVQAIEPIENAAIQLVDNLGRVIQEQFVDVLSGSNSYVFSTNHLKSGTYFIRIKGQDEKFKPVRVVVF